MGILVIGIQIPIHGLMTIPKMAKPSNLGLISWPVKRWIKRQREKQYNVSEKKTYREKREKHKGKEQLYEGKGVKNRKKYNSHNWRNITRGTLFHQVASATRNSRNCFLSLGVIMCYPSIDLYIHWWLIYTYIYIYIYILVIYINYTSKSKIFSETGNS